MIDLDDSPCGRKPIGKLRRCLKEACVFRKGVAQVLSQARGQVGENTESRRSELGLALDPCDYIACAAVQ